MLNSANGESGISADIQLAELEMMQMTPLPQDRDGSESLKTNLEICTRRWNHARQQT